MTFYHLNPFHRITHTSPQNSTVNAEKLMTEKIYIYCMYHIFQLLQSEWEREKSPFPVDTDEWSHLCVLIQQFGAFFIVSVNFG